MTTYTQNVAQRNREIAAMIRLEPLTGAEDETPFLSRPEHPYWKARIQLVGKTLGPLFRDEADSEAFWTTIPDNATAQQVCKAMEREIKRRQIAEIKTLHDELLHRMGGYWCADYAAACASAHMNAVDLAEEIRLLKSRIKVQREINHRDGHRRARLIAQQRTLYELREWDEIMREQYIGV